MRNRPFQSWPRQDVAYPVDLSIIKERNMMFPLGFEGRLAGKIQIDPFQGEDLFIRGMAYDLRDQHARNVSIDGNTIQFDGSWLSYPFKLNMVRGVSNGEISVESKGQQLLVTYRVSLVASCILYSALVVMLGLFLLPIGLESFLKATGMWAILYTGLWVIAKFAFHWWVKWRLSEVQAKKPVGSH